MHKIYNACRTCVACTQYAKDLQHISHTAQAHADSTSSHASIDTRMSTSSTGHLGVVGRRDSSRRERAQPCSQGKCACAPEYDHQISSHTQIQNKYNFCTTRINYFALNASAPTLTTTHSRQKHWLKPKQRKSQKKAPRPLTKARPPTRLLHPQQRALRPLLKGRKKVREKAPKPVTKRRKMMPIMELPSSGTSAPQLHSIKTPSMPSNARYFQRINSIHITEIIRIGLQSCTVVDILCFVWGRGRERYYAYCASYCN